MNFGQIPTEVVEFVRGIFAQANLKVSKSLMFHPFMHEESLDHILVAELSAAPPTYFGSCNTAIRIETHWLGGRRMFGRWEIADIALFVLLRVNGRLLSRKVALLQTKRLYANRIAGVELEIDDFYIGIGRLVDIEEVSTPLPKRRKYRFDGKSKFQQIRKDSTQIQRILEYETSKNIPVYYGLYCPMQAPIELVYPTAGGHGSEQENMLGMRVSPSGKIFEATLNAKASSPSLEELAGSRISASNFSGVGQRVEDFVADEVLACRAGRKYAEMDDPNLGSLLYERSAPISSAIAITIDAGLVG